MVMIRIQGNNSASAVAPGSGTVVVDAVQVERGTVLSDFTDEPDALPRSGLDEIQIWEDDQLIFWGVPWTVRGDHQTTVIECEGLLSYFYKRFVTNTSLEYTSLDQFTIGWNLLSYAQTGANKSFGITAGAFLPSGKVRSRRYERDEHANIYDLLQEFPTLDDGFDFEIVTTGSGLREFWPYYPRKGSSKPELALHWGRNIRGYTFNEDTREMANHVYATGGSSGDVKFENNYQDATAAAKYGVYEAVISAGSYLDVGWLLERAVEEVDKRKAPIKIPELTVGRTPVDLLFLLHTGDTVPVRLTHGRTALKGDYRVVGKTWTPEDDSIKLTLNAA